MGVPRGDGYDDTKDYAGSDYRNYPSRGNKPRDFLMRRGGFSGVGRMVKIIDKGKKMKGSFIASSLTMGVTGGNCGMNVLSTSVAKPSVPGVFNTRSRVLKSRGNLVRPCRAGRNVGLVSMGLLVSGRRSPIV